MNEVNDSGRYYFNVSTRSHLGNGGGSIGRAVASDIRDPRLESRHRQNFIYQLYNGKDENKEKEAGNGPSLKKESDLL